MSRKTSPAAIAGKALSRSYRSERTLALLFGLIAVIAALAALLVSFRVFGQFRGQRPLLDPLAVNWVHEHLLFSRIVAIVLGLALFVFGLWWLKRSLRTEGHPDLRLDRTAGQRITVTSSAIAGAVREDLEAIPAMVKARVRSVGDDKQPALRLSLVLYRGTDVKQAWKEIQAVLERARTSLDLPKLPAAIWLEIDSKSPQRVH